MLPWIGKVRNFHFSHSALVDVPFLHPALKFTRKLKTMFPHNKYIIRLDCSRIKGLTFQSQIHQEKSQS